MNLLVGVDGTSKSQIACQFAGRLLAPGRDHVAVYFQPPRRDWMSMLQFASDPSQTPVEAFVEQVVDQAAARLPAGVTARTIQIPEARDAASGICQAAEQFDADLVVLGAGRSSHRLRFFVGGVTRDVLHRCPRSVLACRENANLDGPLRVLLAIDPEEDTQAIVQLANQLSWPPDTEAHVLHVMDYVEDERLRNWIIESESDVIGDWSGAFDAQVGSERQRAFELLEDFQRQLPSSLKMPKPEIVIGHVVEQIVQHVDTQKIDLVVVGGRCLGRLSRLLGSTTEGLLLQVPASLLVVHAHQLPA